MNAKTILIIVLTVLVTVILMKNADEVEFWIFGTYMVPKLAVLGTMFGIGVLVGLMIGRNRSRKPDEELNAHEAPMEQPLSVDPPLNDEDADYIR